MSLRILLVRHGLSSFNLEHRIQGRDDLSSLTEEGVKQALATGEALRDLTITAAYSSPLRRAHDTATALLAAQGGGLEPRLDDDLLEVDLAPWSGLLSSEVQERFPEAYRTWKQHREAPLSEIKRYPSLSTMAVDSLSAGAVFPGEAYIDDWLSSLKKQGLKSRTIKGMATDVRNALAAGLALDKPSLMACLNMAEEKGKSRVRIQGSIRSFWMFLKASDVIAVDWPVMPPVRRKIKGRQANFPYTAEELQRLLAKLRLGKDREVYRVCLIAAYTGCRINEVVSLKAQDVLLTKGKESIIIRESKTGAGVREIPIPARYLDF